MKSDVRMQNHVRADIARKAERWTKPDKLSKTNTTSYILLRSLMTHLPFNHQLSRVCESLFDILKQ